MDTSFTHGLEILEIVAQIRKSCILEVHNVMDASGLLHYTDWTPHVRWPLCFGGGGISGTGSGWTAGGGDGGP